MKKNIALIGLVFTLLLYAGDISAFDEKADEIRRALMPPEGQEIQGAGGMRGIPDIRPRKESSVTMLLKFGKNSGNLTSQSTRELNRLGRILQDAPLKDFIYRIEGHTCSLGSAANNKVLSFKRAKSVRRYLVNHFDLSEAQFEIKGRGEGHPVASNDTRNGREKNRRVVILNTLRKLRPSSLSDSGQPRISVWSSDSGQPRISVKMKYIRDDRENEFVNGEILTRNDRYAVEFKPITDAYIYIYQIDTAGRMFRIFPNSDYSKISNPLKAGTLYRVPDTGKWIKPDENAEREQIVLLARKESLRDAENICKQVMSPGFSSMMTSRGFKPRQKDSVQTSQTNIRNIFVWKQSFMYR